MFSIAILLDAAKAKAGIESDYRLAKVIGITHSSLSAYRVGKSLPGDKVIEQLCALSGDDAQLIFAQIQASKAATSETKKFWAVMVSRLSGGSATAVLSVVFAIGFIAPNAGATVSSALMDAQTEEVNLLYIVSSGVFISHAFPSMAAAPTVGLFARLFCVSRLALFAPLQARSMIDGMV